MFNNATLYSAIDSLKENILESTKLELSELDSKRTALIIIDMVNGFVKSGALYSSNIEKINEPIAKLALRCETHGIPSIAFCDSHNENSPEFFSYPTHCLKGSEESMLTEEIASSANIFIIQKNSTNAYLEEKFQKWLNENENVVNFIVVGCCTDICVQQFALTLKTHFIRRDIESRIIVPASLTATYDSDEHSAELSTLMAMYNMKLNSVETVLEII